MQVFQRFCLAWRLICRHLILNPNDQALLLCTDEALLSVATRTKGGLQLGLTDLPPSTTDRLHIRCIPLKCLAYVDGIESSSLRKKKRHVSRETFQWLLLFTQLFLENTRNGSSGYRLIVVLDLLLHLKNRSNFDKPVSLLGGPKKARVEGRPSPEFPVSSHEFREKHLLLTVLNCVVHGHHIPGELCLKTKSHIKAAHLILI